MILSIILIIILVFFLIKKSTISLFTNHNKQKQKLKLWTYYNDFNNIPTYLKLCLKTIYTHCNDDFEIILLNDEKIKTYNIRKDLFDFNSKIRYQYIKLYILYNYGGLWIDIDHIVFKNLIYFTKYLKEYEFIGFDCLNLICNNKEDYYNKPSDNLLIVKKKSKIMKNCLDVFDSILDDGIYNVNNFYILRNILWEQLKYLKNYNYYHVNPKYIGSRDIDNDIVSLDRLLNEKNIIFNNFNDIYLIKLNFYQMSNNINLSKENILSSKTIIGKYFRKSLFNHPYFEIPTIYKDNVGIYVLYVPKREIYIKKLIKKIFLEVDFEQGPSKNTLNKMNLIKEGILNISWNSHNKFNLGRCACHIGHLNILQKFMKSDKKYAIIFEDDIYLDETMLDDIRNKINNIINNIPPKTDVLYFSYCWERCKYTKKYNDIFDIPNRPFCRHMYLVSKNGAKIMLKKTIPMDRPGDNMIANLILNKELKAYSVNQKYFSIIQDRETFKSNSDNNNFRLCANGHKHIS